MYAPYSPTSHESLNPYSPDAHAAELGIRIIDAQPPAEALAL